MITFGNRIAEASAVHGKEPVVRFSDILSAEEAAVVNVMVETLRCFSSGKSIDRHFNPTVDNAKQDELQCAMWGRKGELIHVGPAEDKFLHASTVKEACSRKRKFTCFRSLLDKLPKFKDGVTYEET